MPVPKQTTPPPDFIPADPDFIPAGAPATQPPMTSQPSLLDKMKSNFNAATQGPKPGEDGIHSFLDSVGKGGGDAVRSLAHPIRTLQQMVSPGSPMLAPAGLLAPKDSPEGKSFAQQVANRPTWSQALHQAPNDIGEMIGNTAVMGVAGEAGGLALKGAGMAGPALRSAAIGDTDAAALRGLRVPPNGKKVLPMQSSVQTARPYLQGANSLEDLQNRIPAAKDEIFNPYRQTIDAVGDRPVRGPDGMTTIRALEDERQELSAMNRGLRTGDPSALRLAEQKGLSQAQSLAREKAIQAHLDPALSQYGIDPQGIRKAYGSVARIGNQVEGRSTLLEKPQPSGLGKIVRPVSLIDTMEPTGIPGKQLVGPIHQIGGGIRDIVAGRPLWSAKPTDLGIREGFANAGPKPDFGRYTPVQPTGLLGRGAIPMGSGPDTSGPVEGYRPPPVAADTTPMRKGRLLPEPVRPIITPPPADTSGKVSFQPPNFYHDTDAMRTGRLLPSPPIELGGHVQETPPPPFRYDTTPMRKGLILPPPSLDTPLSSHSDIFPDQRPGGSTLLRSSKPEIIKPKPKVKK